MISQNTLVPNHGWISEIKAGQTLLISAMSMLELNCFDLKNPKEYFDTARTRIYNLNLYPTAGHQLFSKQNNPMMSFIEDGFSGIGLHDLQSSHECPEIMLKTISPFIDLKIENLPDPLGLFRNLCITPSGKLKSKPKSPVGCVDLCFKAEIDLICATVNCPTSVVSASPRDCTITLFGSTEISKEKSCE